MFTSEKIVSAPKAKETIEAWKTLGQKVVFTNGCFDILHVGHVEYLEKARKLGDKLVVALNTDQSVSAIKGPLRPIIPQDARARLMAALQFVDLVLFFDTETPKEIIEYLIPDVLVKGADYNEDNIVGSKFVKENGGEVKTIELVEGFSTTKIINKIKESY